MCDLNECAYCDRLTDGRMLLQPPGGGTNVTLPRD
eukprot:gene1064-53493_t